MLLILGMRNRLVVAVVTQVLQKCGADYQQLYNSVQDNVSQTLFYERVKETVTNDRVFSLNVHDLMQSLRKQKLGKAVGFGDVATEAYVFGCSKLLVHVRCNPRKSSKEKYSAYRNNK